MAAPAHVRNDLSQQPRRGLAIPPAIPWRATRPSDLGPGQPVGPLFGNPGPDIGYALKLAPTFAGRLVLGGHEEADVMAGGSTVAMKRASVFGRGPVIHDLTVAFTVWGFLGEAPEELAELRRPLFQSAAHAYQHRRAIADHVPADVLRLPHTEISARFPGRWRSLLGLDERTP